MRDACDAAEEDLREATLAYFTAGGDTRATERERLRAALKAHEAHGPPPRR